MPGYSRIGTMVMTIIWAVNFSVAKVALRVLSPLAFNALRFPLASLALLIVLRMRGRVLLPQRSDLGRIALLGFIGNLVYQQFFIFGLDHSRAGTASLLLAGTPLLTALLSAAVGHERVKPQVWLGVSCTVVGIALVVLFGPTPAGGKASLWGHSLLSEPPSGGRLYCVRKKLVARYGALPSPPGTLDRLLTDVVVGLPGPCAVLDTYPCNLVAVAMPACSASR